eukprot:TRINITY_DN2372_c0_g1_i3.p1 TRINITY_DN2372_c0_g1~~TRINITY_DN2372_c0_g1_i3.p1  ORF type:complete len:403 (+),score=109.36 TRINITY_DN2372_c0_g1_i3:214-1422(+)
MQQPTQETSSNTPPVWNKEHDDHLIYLVETYGDMDWQIIADCFNKKFKNCRKSDKDCRSRWRLFLGTSGRKPLWSDRERYLLLIAHQKYKNRWSEVARMLHKASRNLIKNRFYTLFRKIRNRVKNNDVYINSSLDLLEIYYVLSLVSQYFDEPAEKMSEEKNYAHKLVQRMDKKKVLDYQTRINELYHSKGTIENLFKECGKQYGSGEEAGEVEIEDEAMECRQIELEEEEVKIKITLPCPNDFGATRVMSDEEKSGFWRCAFHGKEARSAQVAYSPEYSVGSSFVNQVQSAGSMAMREDEGFGFSQFINPYENDQKPAKYPNQLLPPSNASSQLSHSPFQPSLGVNGAQMQGSYVAGNAFQGMQTNGGNVQFNGVGNGFCEQPYIPPMTDPKIQWQFPNYQ